MPTSLKTIRLLSVVLLVLAASVLRKKYDLQNGDDMKYESFLFNVPIKHKDKMKEWSICKLT